MWHLKFTRDQTFSQPIVWLTTFFMVAFHVGAIAALFFFSWKALLLAMLFWWVAGGLGIGMGYHRLLTHRGYKIPKWIEYSLDRLRHAGAGRRPDLLGGYPSDASPEYR